MHFAIHLAGSYDFPNERWVEKYVVPHRSYTVFGIGDEVRVVRLPHDGGVPRENPVTTSLARYVGRVQKLFDLALFELDILVHKSIYVIDINPAVNLCGITDGAKLYEESIRANLENNRRESRQRKNHSNVLTDT